MVSLKDQAMIQFEDTAAAAAAETKSARKELRMKPGVAAKIRDVALMVGMDESTFITSAAYQKAQEIEQSQFSSVLPEDQFDAFSAAVASTGERNETLADLMKQSGDTFVDV